MCRLCIKTSESDQDNHVFNEIGVNFSSFFKNLRLYPSDLGSGLILVRQLQKCESICGKHFEIPYSEDVKCDNSVLIDEKSNIGPVKSDDSVNIRDDIFVDIENDIGNEFDLKLEFNSSQLCSNGIQPDIPAGS